MTIEEIRDHVILNRKHHIRRKMDTEDRGMYSYCSGYSCACVDFLRYLDEYIETKET